MNMDMVHHLNAKFDALYPPEKVKEIENLKGRLNLGNPASDEEAAKVKEILAYYGAKLALEREISKL